jgi:putative multiple sugar transport system substrate-binding protein
MKRKLLSVLLTGALAASMFVGCGTSTETTDTTAAGGDTATETTDDGGATAATGTKVGVAMPTKDLQRWNQDGANMQSELEAAGYEVDLQYASNDVQTQVSQIENMINSGCNVIVVAAIVGSSLGVAMDMAAEINIPVIAYDRLIMNSDAVSYYATFDNYKVGQVQGQ